MFGENKIYAKEILSVFFVKPETQIYTRYSIPKQYELVYILSGEAETHFNGKTLHLSPGTVEFLPKNVGDEYYVVRKTHGTCIDIYFDTDCPMPQEALAADLSANPRLKDLFTKILRLWMQKGDGYQYKCMALFYSIFAELQTTGSHYLPTDKYKKIEPGLAYLNEHLFDRDLDYYTPCIVSNISYTYFKRLFIEKFGIPPIQYVTKHRLEYAIELMRLNRFTLTEIATQCGFENLYYFSGVFKKHYGVSPSKYTL